MKYVKTAITTLLAGTLLATACRDGMFTKEPTITFSDPQEFNLPASAQYAEKRGFADVTGDGLEDMIEVNDTAWFGQDYEIIVYPGKNEKGVLLFSEEKKYKAKLPLDQSWSSAKTKVDTGDVNGDGFADFVFTEYVEGIFDDSFRAKVALNQRDGKKFVFASDSYQQGKSLSYAVLKIVAILGDKYGTQDDIDSYLQLDWADVNGDKRDDMMIFWEYNSGKGSQHLHITSLRSGKSNDPLKSVTFYDKAEADGTSINIDTDIPSFMTSRAIKNLDTEDFNGDNLADIILFYTSGTRTTLSIALAESSQNSISYVPQRDVAGEGADLDFLSFEKEDSFDGNFDNLADYVHVGRRKGKPVIVYKFAQKK